MNSLRHGNLTDTLKRWAFKAFIWLIWFLFVASATKTVGSSADFVVTKVNITFFTKLGSFSFFFSLLFLGYILYSYSQTLTSLFLNFRFFLVFKLPRFDLALQALQACKGSIGNQNITETMEVLSVKIWAPRLSLLMKFNNNIVAWLHMALYLPKLIKMDWCRLLASLTSLARREWAEGCCIFKRRLQQTAIKTLSSDSIQKAEKNCYSQQIQIFLLWCTKG